MHHKIETITPSIAKAWLDGNVLRNRHIASSTVEKYAKAMMNGEWKLNGESIKFGKPNELLDGQHRLLAVIKSGATIETVVARGIDKTTFDTIDDVHARKVSDVLSILNEKNYTALAAALNHVDAYFKGEAGRHSALSKIQAQATLIEHPGLRNSVNRLPKTRRLIAGSLLAACHYLFALRDEKQADQFVKDLAEGAGLAAGDPVYALRELLIKAMLDKNTRLDREYTMALVIKAWNFRRIGKKCILLKYVQGEEMKESFPLVQ